MMRQKAHILVVDDDPLLLELLSDTLTTIGHQTTAASDGQEALAHLKTTRFDLVITDVKMPNLDGIQLLRQIRLAYPSLPVLFISAYVSKDMLGDSMPDGFLAKPFRINHVEELITETLQKGVQSNTDHLAHKTATGTSEDAEMDPVHTTHDDR